MDSVYSCGLELEKRGREVPNLANSEFNYSSNDVEEGQTNQPPLVLPLNLRVQTDGKLRENKENLEKCIQTDDWRGNSMDDEVDGAMKNVSCESSAIQHCLPCYSSMGSTEPPFQREGGVTDNLPRITDQVERHGGAAASTSSCNDATDENRRNRECKVDSKSLKVSQEMKNKNQEYLSGRSHNTRPGEFTGLKGGGKVPFFSNRGRSYENRESVTYWNDKDAKPEEVRPQDDMRNNIDKKESNFFGIRPCVLARHSDDSCITTHIDDMGNTRENANRGSSNTFSRNQGSPCLTNAIQLLTPFKPHRFSLKVQIYLLTHRVQTLTAPSILTLQSGIYKCLFVLYSLLPAMDRSISKRFPAMNRELWGYLRML